MARVGVTGGPWTGYSGDRGGPLGRGGAGIRPLVYRVTMLMLRLKTAGYYWPLVQCGIMQCSVECTV